MSYSLMDKSLLAVSGARFFRKKKVKDPLQNLYRTENASAHDVFPAILRYGSGVGGI